MLCPDTAFILSWQQAPDATTAARWTGSVTPHAAACRAWALRRIGVPLKRFDPEARHVTYPMRKRAGRHSRAVKAMIRLAQVAGKAGAR